MKKLNRVEILHISIIVIGTIFASLSIFHNNIWFDEAYSVGIVNHTFSEIWSIGANDVHPILYYWMLHIVKLLTNGSIMAYRIFSAIPIILLGVLGITHISKDFDKKTGLLFSFFSYFLPITIVYINQIRMYSWAIYIVTLLAIYAYRLYLGQTTKKNWLIFFICSLASIYIHYYGLMAAGLINLFLLIYFIKNKEIKSLKHILLFGIIQIIAYVPWILHLLKQMEHVSSGFWIGFSFPTTILELIGCQMNGVISIWSGFIANILLFIILIIVYLKVRKKEDCNASKKAIIIYCTVIISALLITVILRSSILYFRYLYVITGLYIFSVSNIMSKIKNKYIIIIICILVGILSITNNIEQIKENYDDSNWKQVEYLQHNIQEKDIIVYKNIGNGSIFASIFKNNKQYFYNPEDWGIVEAYKAWAPQMETFLDTSFLEKCTGRIWIIDSENNEFFNELFNNEEYERIETITFSTSYQNYTYNITLVEKKEK